MAKGIIILVLILIAIVLYGLLGPPNEIGIPKGVVWRLHPEEGSASGNTIYENTGGPLFAKDAIKISRVVPRRDIYSIGEQAKVDIIIDNPKNLNYSLYVYWIHGGDRILGLTTSNNTENSWVSWFPVNEVGPWKINVVVNWTYKNNSYDADGISEIEVY
jgi:hypothetical protein